MSPKEQAIKILDSFDLPSGLMSSERKECALISIDLVLYAITEDATYWQEVKEEIKKLKI